MLRYPICVERSMDEMPFDMYKLTPVLTSRSSARTSCWGFCLSPQKGIVGIRVEGLTWESPSHETLFPRG